MTHFTVLGAAGYIGRALVVRLEQAGHVVNAVSRASLSTLLDARQPAGHVMSCIGLTGDFRSRPLDTAEAHIGITARCLAALQCDSFLYLSSTRVYAHADRTDEDALLRCHPSDPSDLYNLTKLAGEALCLSDPRSSVRVARLSNVFGPGLGDDNFLGQVLREGRNTGRVLFGQAPESQKDYVDLDAVLRLLPKIATTGCARLYNVAAGQNTTHQALADALHNVFGWNTAFLPDAPLAGFRPISVGRVNAEFGGALTDFLGSLATLHAC